MCDGCGDPAIFSIATTAGQILTGILAGYAFAMFDFPAKRILFYLVLSGLMMVAPGYLLWGRGPRHPHAMHREQQRVVFVR